MADPRAQDRRTEKTEVAEPGRTRLRATDLRSATTSAGEITLEPASGSHNEGKKERPPFPWRKYIDELQLLTNGYEQIIKKIQETTSTSEVTEADRKQTAQYLVCKARLEQLELWRMRWEEGLRKRGEDALITVQEVECAIQTMDKLLADEWNFLKQTETC